MKLLLFLVAFGLVAQAYAANPYLPLWEYIPDGEPYVFDDPDHPGKRRVYVYGSHDCLRSEYCGRDQVWVKRPNAAEGGVKVGSFRVSADWPEAVRKVEVEVAPLASLSGKQALFFTFDASLKEQSICELHDFRFRAD